MGTRTLIGITCLIASKLTYALVLEDQKDITKLLDNNKIGFYTGSFDPIHKGHEGVINQVLDKNLTDYVLVYPAWGNDDYKNRVDINIRLDMLFSIFKDSPKVIVTRLSPRKLQKLLTIDSDKKYKNKPLIKVKTKTEYIGVVGSDSAIYYSENDKARSMLMRGIKIPKKFAEHTIGGIIALPAKRFIVVMRHGDNLSDLNGKIGNRKISSIVHNPKFNKYSSTKVKAAIKAIDQMLDPKVYDIVYQNKLYK